MGIPLNSTPQKVSINSTTARQTPKTDFGDRLKAGVSASAEITPATIGNVFKDLLEGIGSLESYLRTKGVATRPEMSAVMTDLAMLKTQFNRIVRYAKT